MEDIVLHMKQHIINAEVVKSLVLNTLLENKVITKDQHDVYYSDHHIIIIKPNWFKSLINKFGSKITDDYVYKYVKF